MSINRQVFCEWQKIVLGNNPKSEEVLCSDGNICEELKCEKPFKKIIKIKKAGIMEYV